MQTRARALRWWAVSMRPVEPPQALAGNPGASPSVLGHHRYRRPCHRRRQHHRHRGRRDAGASAGTAQHGQTGRVEIAGTGLRCRAEQRHATGAGTAGRSSGCHGRSGCTVRPGRGSVRTGTAGLEGPYAPRQTEGAGRKRPKRATLLWHHLHRHGVGRGTVVKLASTRDRCRAQLLRHGAVVSRAPPRPKRVCRRSQRPHPDWRPPHGIPPATSAAPARSPCRATGQAQPLQLVSRSAQDQIRHLTSE